MHFDRSAVQGGGLHLQTDDLLLLQGLKDPRQNAGFDPSAHPCVDGVPMTKLFGQPPPFGTIFGNVENGVESLQAAVFESSAGLGKTVRDALVLFLGDLHPNYLLQPRRKSSFTLTRPS